MDFAELPFALIRSLISPDETESLLLESRAFPARAVTCGGGAETWTERSVFATTRGALPFHEPAFIRSMVDLTGILGLR